jgi:phosphosulfolactate phosphohydrolase-like enzyme
VCQAQGQAEIAALLIPPVIRASVSGRQLIDDGGFPQDVEIAVEENVSAAAPTLTDGAYRDEIAPSEPTQPSRR